MKQVEIKLFDEFRVIIDGRELPLVPSVKEIFALLVVGAGHRITAKSLWKHLYEYKGIKFNSTFYTARMNDMKSELESFHITDLLAVSESSIRFCRLNVEAVHCDYYEMLDGKIPLKPKEQFLPEYPWAAELYSTSWEELKEKWDAVK